MIQMLSFLMPQVIGGDYINDDGKAIYKVLPG